MGLAPSFQSASPCARISQHYQQSLQPFADPELLELADSKPQYQQLTLPQPATGTPRSGSREVWFTLLVIGLCLLGAANWMPSFAGLLPALQTSNGIATQQVGS